MKLLDDKVAIVTGGGSGFGRAMSLLYAKEGAKVVVSDIVVERGEETVNLIKKDGGEAIFVKVDASSAVDNENLVKKTADKYGRLDIAFNNAGIGGSSAPIGEYPVESWDKIIAVNLSSVFYGMHYQIPQMLKSGGGVIVNMASILGQVGFAGACGYVAAKHGVVGLTKNVALEYGTQGIRANSVGPGFVETNLTQSLIENKEAYDFLVYKHPMGRLGKVDEIVDLVLWLSSDRASFCNGGYYTVDGGYLAK
ncbi:MAG: glucose 1-dehydrogenase [Flavobacteriaceae bacterium]|jgi:NAD(P)-dependent dehydrogenase (short-subunit alcohol dehydrogenase family)|nr:glucose 1-dehydrogenase [Flavobacteriaceae bacterium]